MPAFLPALPEASAGPLRCRGGSWAIWGATMVVLLAGAGPNLAQSSAPPPLRVSYLAELPVSWRTGLADPIHNIARSLCSAFARPVDPELRSPTGNLLGAESWEELSRSIQLGSAELFPLHGYEMVERARELKLKPLLLATRNGRWQTHFVLLVSNASGIQNLRDLENRTLLVHRDGCGDLVDYWLDTAIAVGTGMQRQSFARYQTVTQAREAVLPVFFGEADACVVSVAAYQSVVAQNPVQIPAKLTPLVESKDLPGQVVACRVDLPVDVQRRVLEQARRLTWDFGEETGTLIPAEELAFDNMRALLAERAKPIRDSAPAAIPPSAKLQSSAPAQPARRP